jgi:hypothetical protein
LIVGAVLALNCRPARGSLPVRVDRAGCLAGAGIDGDIHADALSPRQLLLAGAGVYQDLSLPPHALHENLLLDLDSWYPAPYCRSGTR